MKKRNWKILGYALGNLNLRGESLDGTSVFKCVHLYSIPDGITLRKAYNPSLTEHSGVINGDLLVDAFLSYNDTYSGKVIWKEAKKQCVKIPWLKCYTFWYEIN